MGEISNQINYKLLYVTFFRHCTWAREPLHSHFLATRGENMLSCLHNRQILLCRYQQNLPVKTKIGPFLQLFLLSFSFYSCFPYFFLVASFFLYSISLRFYTSPDDNWYKMADKTKGQAVLFVSSPPRTNRAYWK